MKYLPFCVYSTLLVGHESQGPQVRGYVTLEDIGDIGPCCSNFCFLRLVRFLAIKAESQLEILKISK